MTQETKEATCATAAEAECQPKMEIQSKFSSAKIKMVMFSLCLAQFLSALDITIVATALPTIASHLNASTSSYTWVGSAYTLASTSSTPLWAKLSDIWGRKPVLLLANGIFLAGSLVAALSRSMTMLICGRALQGVGGGGLMILVSVIIADLFTLRDRAKYYGLTAIVWAISSALGPILGGVFTQTLSWRWCFYINLPLDGVSLLLLFFTLKLEPPRESFLDGLKTFDWVGSAAVVGGTICFLYGLESGASSTHAWSSAFTICLMVSGTVMLLLFALYEWKFAKHPIVPLRVFLRRSNLASLATAFLHGFVFISFDYFLPLYFQAVLHASPIHSGLYLFALVCPLSAISAGTGLFVRRTGKYRVAIWFGSVVMTTGTGLFIDFEAHTVWWKIILYQFIAGVGSGPLFLGPMIALQSHLKNEDVTAGISAFIFLKNISTSISIVVGGVVLQKGLSNGSLTVTTSSGSQDSHSSSNAGSTRQEYTSALANMWIFYTTICGLMLASSLLIDKKDLSPPNVTTSEEFQQEKALEAGQLDLEGKGPRQAQCMRKKASASECISV